MRNMLIIVTVCCMALGSIAAEPASAVDNKPQVGDKALLFQTGTNLIFSSLSNSILGLKYHNSTNRAIEIRIGFGTGMNEYDRIDEDRDSLGVELRERNNDRFDINTSLSALYIFYRSRPSNILPYLGIGPLFSYRYNSSEEDLSGSGYSAYQTKQKSTYIGVGVIGELGFEWFVLPKVSLRASYRAKMIHTSSRDVRENWSDDEYNKDTTERRGLDFGDERTDLGIALYF